MCTAPFAAAKAGITDPPSSPFSLSANISLFSDYRFRGISRSNNNPAVQGSFTVSHQSGFYLGAWSSSLAGWGKMGDSKMELDIFGGYRHTLGAFTVDGGVMGYIYPAGGGGTKNNLFELYGNASTLIGPFSAKLGFNFAPPQYALGRYYPVTLVKHGDHSNVYAYGEADFSIPRTAAALHGHIGHTSGQAGFGPNFVSLSPTGDYWDWRLGADYTFIKHVKVGVWWSDTNIDSKSLKAMWPSAEKGLGHNGSIVGSAALFSLTLSL
ncbi:exported protein [Zymomonas mobilis subsp. pomaceae]|nr:exported protein [Zymomonas mobilis subsp. pomaceae]